jgi:hypothetical protein
MLADSKGGVAGVDRQGLAALDERDTTIPAYRIRVQANRSSPKVAA